MICDWYQATIYDNIQNVKSILTGGDELKLVQAKTGLNGYTDRWFLNDENGNTMITILYGSPNPNQQYPHLISTSENANRYYKFIRENWSDRHVVTRVDVAEDMNQPDLFNSLSEKLIKVAKDNRIKTSVSGDWISGIDGRTLYLGSPASPVRVRLYEKGKQVANEMFYSRGFAHPTDFPIDWVRLELQCRPKKLQRAIAHKTELEDFWGFASWSRVVADDLLSLNVPRVSALDWQQSNDERTFKWLAKQYGNFLSRVAEKNGNNWALVGLELELYVRKYLENKK